jgi:hypothetical protein
MGDRVLESVEQVLRRHLSNITTFVVMEWCRRVLRNAEHVASDEIANFLSAVRCSAGFFLNDRALAALWQDVEALRFDERENRPTQRMRIGWRSGDSK